MPENDPRFTSFAIGFSPSDLATAIGLRPVDEGEAGRLRRELREAASRLQQMEAALNQVAQQAPSQVGRVLRVVRSRKGGDKSLVHVGNQTLCLTPLPDLKPRPGDAVNVVGGAIVDVLVDEALEDGLVVTAVRVGDGWFEADAGNGPAQRFGARELDVEVGDRMLVLGTSAVRNLGPAEAAYALESEVNVPWDRVGGHAEAKAALREAVEDPHVHAELYRAYGRRQTRGVLLYGPPGCGKTMLAKATATALARVHGERHASGFIYVKGPELLSKWVGETEQRVRALFAAAREHKAKHGYPAVIFIDEADAILGRRGGRSESDRSLSSTVVPQFLAELDGFDDPACVMLLGTNRPESLDAAVVRDGRVDRRVYVGRPSETEAADIAAIHLTGMRLGNELGGDQVARALFDERRALYRALDKDHAVVATFSLGHVASGAMVENLCQLAATRALARDIGAGSPEPTGILAEDVEHAADRVLREQRDVDHSEALIDFARAAIAVGARVERVSA